MSKSNPILKAALSSLLALAAASAAHLAWSQPTSAGDPIEGKRLFLADGCSACHGTAGAGGGPTGLRLAPSLTFDAVRGQLRHPARMMPAYSEAVMSDAQIADIVAFLRSIPPGRTAAQIPLLSH